MVVMEWRWQVRLEPSIVAGLFSRGTRGLEEGTMKLTAVRLPSRQGKVFTIIFIIEPDLPTLDDTY